MITIPAVLKTYSRRANGSMGISIHIPAMITDDILEIDRLQGREGWFMFKENHYDSKDIPTETAEVGEKSLSKRYYNTLFVWWQQQTDKGEITGTFNDFYSKHMEDRISIVKDNLD